MTIWNDTICYWLKLLNEMTMAFLFNFFLWWLFFNDLSLSFQAGFARAEKKNRWDPKEKQAELEKFVEFQEVAKKQRLNIWHYGDIGSDEEDNASSRGSRRWSIHGF